MQEGGLIVAVGYELHSNRQAIVAEPERYGYRGGPGQAERCSDGCRMRRTDFLAFDQECFCIVGMGDQRRSRAEQ